MLRNLADIQSLCAGAARFEGIFSLNAGVLAAILLGSRLQDADTTAALSPSSAGNAAAHMHCFAFILAAFLVFAGGAVASHWIRVSLSFLACCAGRAYAVR